VPADAAPLLLQLVAAQARILRSHADPRERGDGRNRERLIVEAARLRRELAALAWNWRPDAGALAAPRDATTGRARPHARGHAEQDEHHHRGSRGPRAVRATATV